MHETKNLHNKPLFATWVYDQKLINKSHALKKFNGELKKEAYMLLKSDLEGHKWSESNYHEGYTSYGSSQSGLDRLHLWSSTFADLEKAITKHVKKYLKQLDYGVSEKDLEMTHLWVNIMPTGSLHTSHIHPLSVISGTYYVSVPKGAGGIRFEDPRLSQLMNAPMVCANAKLQNQRMIELDAADGNVVLFESWLKHEVPVNKSKSERISISFNYGWRR